MPQLSAFEMVLRTVRYCLWDSIPMQRLYRFRWPTRAIHPQATSVANPRALVIDVRIPTPDQDAGSQHILKLLHLFQNTGFAVHFLPANLVFTDEKNLGLLASEQVTVVSPGWSIRRFLSRHVDSYDVVVLSRYAVARRYTRFLKRRTKVKIVFNTEDLHHVRYGREAEIYRNSLLAIYARKVRREELLAVGQSDATVVVSPVEFRELITLQPRARVVVVSLASTVATSVPDWPGRYGIVFVGGFTHFPNVDGMEYFLREVWPKILRIIPEIELQVIGQPDIRRQMPSLPRIQYLGHVDTITPYLDRCRLTVAPLRFGAGIKGKVIESLSRGVPVVSTPIGAEGIKQPENAGIAVAHSAEEMASLCARLYNDPATWKNYSINALKYSMTKALSDTNQEVVELLRVFKTTNPP